MTDVSAADAESIDKALKELNSGFDLPAFEVTDSSLKKSAVRPTFDLKAIESEAHSMDVRSDISYKYGAD